MPTRFADLRFQSPDGLTLACIDRSAAGGDRAPVLCLPGLTRNHRDFDPVAERLARGRRVLCADLRGRGLSDPAPDPKTYQPSRYVRDVLALLDHVGVERVVVLGTSLGGLVAILLAATQRERVAGIIVNDIGPEIDPAGIARIASFVGQGGPFASWEEAVETVRAQQGSCYPNLAGEDWVAFTRNLCIEDPDGSVRLDYDPRIAETFGVPDPAGPRDDPWALWARLRDVPALVLRGESSDILAAPTLERMAREKPDLEHTTVRGVGHAPLLTEPECVRAIDAFLERV